MHVNVRHKGEQKEGCHFDFFFTFLHFSTSWARKTDLISVMFDKQDLNVKRGAAERCDDFIQTFSRKDDIGLRFGTSLWSQDVCMRLSEI